MNKTILEVISWEEPQLEDALADNPVTVAKIRYKATGHLEGEMFATYLLYYTVYDKENPHQSKATFTGYTRFVGTVEGQAGEALFLENGQYGNGLSSCWTLMEGHSAGYFTHYQGSGSYSIEGGKVVLQTEF